MQLEGSPPLNRRGHDAHQAGPHTPGTHIPIVSPGVLETDTPDYCPLLSCYADAILKKEATLRKRSVKFIVPVPRLEVV